MSNLKCAALFVFLILTCFLGCVGSGPWGIPIAGQGFDGAHDPKPGQDMAQLIVWNYTFNRELGRGTPPPVVWRVDDVPCTDQYGTYMKTFHDPWSGECVLGVYDQWQDYATIEWFDSFSLSSYSHELCHALKQYTTGDPDINHDTNCFSMPGVHFNNSYEAEGSLVDLANKALAGAGL